MITKKAKQEISNLSDYCTVDNNSELNKVVVTKYSKPHKTLTMYCLYKDSQEDMMIQMNGDREGQWHLIQKENIGNGVINWPIYF